RLRRAVRHGPLPHARPGVRAYARGIRRLDETGGSGGKAMTSVAATARVPHAHHDDRSFIRKYIFSTDHKIIGIQFLFVSLFFLFLGGLLAMQIRWQLGYPGRPMPGGGILPATMAPGGVILPEYYIQLVTMHGTFQVFFAIMLLGPSSILGSLNCITTIINHRTPGMTWFRLPLSVWALFITAILGLLALPVLSGAAIMLLFEQILGTHFFDPAAGGQVLLWQHLFWFFGHPEVYILILPAMGMVSDIVANGSRKPIFGYHSMVFAIIAIAFLGWLVWGHHMFMSGMNPTLGSSFMVSTLVIAVPSAVKVFNWMGTMWRGNLRF